MEDLERSVNRPKVTIFMNAYNAEKYLEETLQSVLAQTEPAWEMVLCDNASTDNTGAICEQYAKQDKRIRVFHNKVNCVNDNGATASKRKYWPTFYGEYITSLDSDDLLHPQFVERTYQQAQQHQADIVVVGSIFFQDGKKPYKTTGIRKCPSCKIENDQEFERYFGEIYPCFRPVWGKVFRMEFFEEHYGYAWELLEQLSNGADTYVTLGYLEKADIIVGIDQALHYYRVRSASGFHTLDTSKVERIHRGVELFDRGYQCVKAHNSLTQRNIQYLYSVLVGHMWDLLNLVKTASCSNEEKLSYIHHMFQKEEKLDRSFFIIGWNTLQKTIWEILGQSCSNHFSTGIDWANYLIRLYASVQELKQGTYLQFVAYYAALCDRENVHHIGMAELPKRTPYYERELLFQQQTEEQQASWLCSGEKIAQWFTYPSQNIQFERLVQQLEIQLQNQQLENVIETLEKMTEIKPLDRIVLYFRGLISWQIGECEIGLKLLQCAYALYPDDAEICSLRQDMMTLATQQGEAL